MTTTIESIKGTDFYKLRKMVVNNVWPESILREYHPRESYTGKQEDIFRITKDDRPGLFMANPVIPIMLDENIEEGLLSMAFTGPGFSMPMEMLSSFAMHSRGFAGRIEKQMNQSVDIIMCSKIMSYCADMVRESEEKKNFRQDARPPTYQMGMRPNDFDGWSTFAAVNTKTIMLLSEMFGIDSDDDAAMMFDTAYLLAMFPAMAGFSSIYSCLQGMELAGMMRMDKSTGMFRAVAPFDAEPTGKKTVYNADAGRWETIH